MKTTKTKVEELMRNRGMIGEIVWRDNRKSTYQSVYDYLMKHPDYKFEDFIGEANDAE